MGAETPEQKFNRLRDEIQRLYLSARPNPNRVGCPGTSAIEAYARLVAARQSTNGDPTEKHVHQCSPCYREFLETRRRLRDAGPEEPAKKMSWFRRRQLGKTLDQLEEVMKSVAQEVRRR